MLVISQVTRCCAMAIIHDFGGAHGIVSSKAADENRLKELLKTYGDNYSVIQVNLNADQKPVYHGVLTKNGFKMVASGIAAGSGSKCYHYVRPRGGWKKPKKKPIKLESWER